MLICDTEINKSKYESKTSTLKYPKIVFKTNYRIMQVKSIAECFKHSAILLTLIKLPIVTKIFVLSILSDRFKQVLLYILCTVSPNADALSVLNLIKHEMK